MQKNRFFNTYNLVFIAIMTGMSLVLSEFPKIPIFFLKVDFSDVPIIFSAVYIHPTAGVFIALVKNLVGLASSSTMFVGELSNFILSTTYCLVASLMFYKTRTKTKLVISSVTAIIAVTAMALLTNYFMMIPLYIKLYGLGALRGYSITAFLFTIILPFNLAKFSLETAVFLALYLALYKVLYKFKPEFRNGSTNIKTTV
ncbi:MAG TPA: ECF transporter S component [Clostridia bacterium]